MTHQPLVNFQGFSARPGLRLGSKLAVSSYIGDMTGDGGLAAAFNGTTNAAKTACATIDMGADQQSYVGANFSSSPKRIFKAKVSGSNDNGYLVSQNTSMNIDLYVKTTSGAPSSGTNGLFLGRTSFSDTGNESALRDVNIDLSIAGARFFWTTPCYYAWINVSASFANLVCCVAEVEFYEAI